MDCTCWASAPTRKVTCIPCRAEIRRLWRAWNPAIFPFNFSSDGHSVYLYHTGDIPAKVYKVELGTGKKAVFRELAPLDPTGISTIAPVLMTPDGKSYVYGFHRTVGDLYLVEGLK